MSDVVIRVENLWKEYRLGAISHASMKKDLESWWARVRGKEDPNALIDLTSASSSTSSPFTLHPSPPVDRFWALKDVSFEVKQGDVLGIVGRNGAGKSTLLKILSKVTTPTRGNVKIRGRIASLLEVGTGFHPELTGRENVFLNGAILGMSKEEIRQKFDEIVDFAEIENFIDTPVKRYSSGMYVRLAFGVAAHLEPEILILDEVLAVGDASFQKKCLGKMEDVGKQGRTVLFVSHNLSAVSNLCMRCVMMEGGLLAHYGDTEDVLNKYIDQAIETKGEVAWHSPESMPGDDVVRLSGVKIQSEGKVTVTPRIDKEIEIIVEYVNHSPGKKLCVSIHLNDKNDNCVFASGNLPGAASVSDRWGGAPHSKGSYSTTCRIPANFLNNALYRVSVFLISDVTNIHLRIKDIITFDVQDMTEREYLGDIIGAVRPTLHWSTEAR